MPDYTADLMKGMLSLGNKAGPSLWAQFVPPEQLQAYYMERDPARKAQMENYFNTISSEAQRGARQDMVDAQRFSGPGGFSRSRMQLYGR